jgi:glucokinase
MGSATDPVIGVDVGASTISAGLVARDGTVLTAMQQPTGNGQAVTTIVALIDDLLDLAERAGLRVAGIGIGLPGIVDVGSGQMRIATENWVAELAHRPLAQAIRERSRRIHPERHRIFLDNDANALALAESMFGLGRGVACLVTLVIGTGIGGGVVLDGSVLRGRLGTAGEIGHVAVGLEGPRCVCGNVGCLSVYASGRLMADRARERLARYPGSAVLAEAGDDPRRITARLLYGAAAAGDALARAVVDEAREALAVAVGMIATLLNPDVVVITGGVASSLAPLENRILKAAAEYAFARALAQTRVTIVPGDKRVTMRGAAALVLYERQREEEQR